MKEKFTTFTGIPVDENLWEALSKLYHPRAYGEVGGKSYLSDVSNGFLVRRLQIVFGPRGIAWGLDYEPGEIVIEPTTSSSGKSRYDATILKATFWYSIYGEDGERNVAQIHVSSGSNNDDRGDAIKGALSGCIKKAVSYLGHQNALYRGDLSHTTVKARWNKHGSSDPLQEAQAPTGKKNTGASKKEKEEPVERPMEPNAVREKLQDRAMQYKGRTATDNQRKAVPMWLSQCFPKDSNSTERHTMTEWVYGESSTKELSDGQVLALIDWLAPNDENMVSTFAIAEAQRMYREAGKAQGQEEMEI